MGYMRMVAAPTESGPSLKMPHDRTQIHSSTSQWYERQMFRFPLPEKVKRTAVEHSAEFLENLSHFSYGLEPP